jgi:galactokinase
VVITNSLTPHELTDSAPEQYNLRVVEVLVAARILAHSAGLDDLTGVNGKRIWLKEVLDASKGKYGVTGERELLERGLKEAEKVLSVEGRGETGWTREEMIQASGMSPEEFTKTYLEFLESGSLL